MDYTGVEIQEAEDTLHLETTFDEAFKLRPEAEQKINKGRLPDLQAFENQHFHTLYQPHVLTHLRAQINARLRKYGARIEPPDGPATIFLDFFESSQGNGCTFVQDGKYFIAISSQMLLDFDRAAVALAGSDAVHDLLITERNTVTIPPLCTALLVLQLQFIAFHELGHIFHGHRDARSFRQEYRMSYMDELRLKWPDQDLSQANEWLVDRYAVRMLLQDLIGTQAGFNMAAMIGTKLSQTECILWLVLLSIASVFFVGPSETFYEPLVRKRDHPADLARLNIIMRSIVEWGQSQGLPEVVEWASSTRNFEWVTACISDAVPSEERREDWLSQGEYLRSPAGQEYLDVLYKEDGVLTEDVTKNWWKV